jgi:hypothetical protein
MAEDPTEPVTRESLAEQLRRAYGSHRPAPDEQYALLKEARGRAALALENALNEIEAQVAQGVAEDDERIRALAGQAANLDGLVGQWDARLMALKDGLQGG